MASVKNLLALLLICSIVSSAIAATCNFNTQNSINVADITNLGNNVATNSFNPPLDSPLGFTALSTHSVNLGTAQFCMRNDFLFESTHIALSDIQFGADDIVSQCCSNAPVCQGGQFTITGDDGITVVLSVQPIGDACDP
ncbi:unnamed protein product [Calypogeia fissa]